MSLEDITRKHYSDVYFGNPCNLDMSLEDIIREYHSDDDLSFGHPKDTQAIINAALTSYWIALPFHAMDKPCVSSSLPSQVLGFRQKTCQAYYINDPVRYDLTIAPLRNHVKVA
jgi:hypothetical protein